MSVLQRWRKMKDGCGVAEQQTRRVPATPLMSGGCRGLTWRKGGAERRRTLLLWPGPVLCPALQCAVAARSDASMDDGRTHAGIVAHARVLDLDGRILTGLDAHMHIPVRGIHEAETIGVELSLWLLGHSVLSATAVMRTSGATQLAWCTQAWSSTATVKVRAQTDRTCTAPWCMS